MCTSTPSVETAEVTPEAPTTPDSSASIGSDSDTARRRAAAGTSGRSTILTSSRGTTSSGSTATKTLLGQ